ncbi:MAG: discoidin domain-containing protein [Clostridium sp.]|nr:discoidin domain-containing protein [Clostridium sp.]
MYEVSTAYKNYIANNLERNYKIKLTIGTDVIDSNDIFSYSIETNQPSDKFTIGNAISQILKIEIKNQEKPFYTNQLYLQIGMLVNGSYEYVPIGYFNVDKSEKKDHRTTLTCYDNMYKLEGLYVCQLGKTKTIKDIMDDIGSKTGIKMVTDNYSNYTISDDIVGYSYREVVAMMAGLNGGNAYIDRTGKIKFVYLSDSSTKWSINDFSLFDGNSFKEQSYTIDKVTCYKDKDTSWSHGNLGTTPMVIEYENPFMTQAIAKDIYTKLANITYQAFSMDTMSYLALDVGDWITYTSQSNTVYSLCIQHYKFSGGIKQTLEAKTDGNKNNFNANGSLTQKVNRTITDLLAAKKAIIDKANIDDLVASKITVETLNGGSATLQEILTSFISGTEGQFLHLTSGNVVIDEAVIKELIAARIKVSDLMAGAINTSKFNVTSDDGGINISGSTQQFKDKNGKVRLQIGKDAEGNFTFVLVGEDGTTSLIDENGITKNAIPEKVIVNDMVADNANISGSKLDIESLFNVINNDGSHTFKDSKIKLSDSDQTLDVAFKEINTKVNNIKYSGENLLRYSRSFNQNWWTGRYNAELTNETTYKGLICYKTTGQWGRLDQGYEVEQGKTYTFSAYIKGIMDSGTIPFSFFSGNGDIVDSNIKMGNAHTYWYRYSYTFTAKATGGVRLGFQPSQSDIGTTKYLLVCGIKLCEGENTVYTENPLDYKPTTKNLYRGTGTFDSKYWTAKNLLPYELNNKYKMAKYNYGELGIDVLSTPTASQGFDFNNTKKIYTISALFKASNDNMTIGITVSTGRVGWQKKALTKGQWVQLYWTFAGDGKSLERFRFEGLTGTTGDYVYIAQVKVSESALADEWCPHEQDDLEKALWLEDNLNKNRNYCLRDWYCKYNTVLNIEDKTDYYSIKCIKVTEGHHAYAKLYKKLEVGKTYTVSICIKNTMSVILRPYEIETPVVYTDFQLNIPSSADYKIYATTFKVTNTTTNALFITSTDFKAVGDEVDVKWVMLNEGELAKDFQLAPEDIISKTNSLQTEFNVQQGRINDLIKDTTIEVSGTSTKLKDAYSQFVQTQNGVNLTVANLNTEVLGTNGIKSKVSSVETKVTDEAFKVQVNKNRNSKYKVRYIRDWLNGSTASSNNLWNMIQAWNNTGIDRASGKTVISNLAITNPTYATDDDYATNASGTGKQYVQIDLGKVYEDIDVIKVWHYYIDGRTFHGTKTEISSDGTHWTTLFDSSISGEYAENRNGHYVKVNDTCIYNPELTVNEEGLTIEDGGIKIKKNGKKVFGVNDTGDLYMQGIFEQVDPTTGWKSVAIKNNGVEVYDWRLKNDLVGGLTSVEYKNTGRGGAVLYSDYGNVLGIGYRDRNGTPEDPSGSTFHNLIEIDDTETVFNGMGKMAFWDKYLFYGQPIFMSDTKHFNYAMNIYYGNDHNIPIGRVVASNNNNIALTCSQELGNSVVLGMHTSEARFTYLLESNKNGTTVYGNLSVTGTKNRLVDVGDSYLALNAYETCSPYFGDVGDAVTNEEGYCKIVLDEEIKKTINTKMKYQVFLTVYGDEDTWARCIERTENYFLIKGSPNTEFGWEIKARQKGFEKIRLLRKEKGDVRSE